LTLRGAAALAMLALAACATVAPAPSPPRVGLAALPGWDAEDHLAAFGLARESCAHAAPAARPAACAETLAAHPLDDRAARAFLEAHFRPERVAGEGVLTGYFSPTYEARRAREGEFTAPVRPKPTATREPPDRAALEQAPASDALAWMRPEDLFFLQIQGSGVLAFPDGGRSRALFAGSNGWPYVAIAKPMADLDLIPRAGATASDIHAWLAANRGPHAQAIMDLDPRYVFFRLLPDDGGEPIGAAGAPLIPGRSLAIDPASHPYFELLWIDAEATASAPAKASYQRLVTALDTGAAIKGAVRGDLYLGQGDAAGAEAGAVRHALRLYRIVPVEAGAP
jgi:membrane-bound lytic murein transglycosylase A